MHFRIWNISIAYRLSDSGRGNCSNPYLGIIYIILIIQEEIVIIIIKRILHHCFFTCIAFGFSMFLRLDPMIKIFVISHEYKGFCAFNKISFTHLSCIFQIGSCSGRNLFSSGLLKGIKCIDTDLKFRMMIQIQVMKTRCRCDYKYTHKQELLIAPVLLEQKHNNTSDDQNTYNDNIILLLLDSQNNTADGHHQNKHIQYLIKHNNP